MDSHGAGFRLAEEMCEDEIMSKAIVSVLQQKGNCSGNSSYFAHSHLQGRVGAATRPQVV